MARLPRFLLTALAVLVLLMGLFGYAVELSDAGARFDRPSARVATPYRWGGWLVESAALTALFLLIQGRAGAWWIDGLVTGWIAWIFRGPVLVLSVVAWSRMPREPWWALSLRWFLLYTLCGLALALLARRAGVERRTEASNAS
jgi:hypothetical protein